MASVAQLTASRFNALQHGLEARPLVIPGEDPAELEALALDYYNQFHPEGPLERFLVDTLVRADWDRRRYTRMEGQLLQSGLDALESRSAQLVFRRLAYAERLYFRSLKELRRAQKDRAIEDEVGQALPPAKPLTHSSAPNPQPLAPEEIGFVPESGAGAFACQPYPADANPPSSRSYSPVTASQE